MPLANKHDFQLLLQERNQHPERAGDIDRRIFEAFGRDVAILVLDMGGFSRLTLEFGIIHFLAMVEQMSQTARPIVAHHRGETVKVEADNLFAIFPEPEDALLAAIDIRRAFDRMNDILPDGRRLYACFGIGFGQTIVLDGEDLFGSEMNLTCKLGEDLAENSEILMTAVAHARLPEGAYPFTPEHFSISEVEIECFRYAGDLSEIE